MLPLAMKSFIEVIHGLDQEIFPSLQDLTLVLNDETMPQDRAVCHVDRSAEGMIRGKRPWLADYIKKGFLHDGAAGWRPLRRLAVDIVTEDEKAYLQDKVFQLVIDMDPSEKWLNSYW